MSTMTKDDGVWILPIEMTLSLDNKTVTIPTENKFVDGDIHILLSMTNFATQNVSVTDNSSGSLTWGTASGGKYYPTASISGAINTTAAGWHKAEGDSGYAAQSFTDSSVQVGQVNQSIIQLAGSTISSGSTVTPTSSDQTITITEGYNAARTIIVGSTSSSTPGAVTSGSATIDSLSYSYNSTSDLFLISGSADVSAPTVDTAGYISGSVGTRSANTGGATVSTSVAKIILNSTLTGATTARKPSLSKQAISITGVTDAASGSAQTTAPTTGVYVAVQSGANTATITSAPTVATAGYGTTTNFGVNSAATATVGAAQSDIHYIPITTTSASVSGRTVTYGSGWITAGSSQVALGTVTSGAGTATISAPSYDTTNAVFTQSASGTIAAPTVNTAGYVSSTEGTKNTNSISGSKTLDVVKVGVTVSGTAKVTPVIARTAKPSGDTWVDAASGAVTTTKPTSGAYVRVDAEGKTSTITSTGKVSAEGYGTTDHYLTDTATSTTVGSNAATSAYVPITAGTVTSGSATISSATVAYSSTNGNYNLTGSATVAAPSIGTAGYIASNVGTRNTNTATLAATLPKIGIQANLSGTGTKKPSISKHSNTNVDSSAATTTQPSSGYYVAVSSAANTGTVQATASVSSAGYGTTTTGQYTTTPSSSLTIGASASDTTYIPLTAATLNNTATSGVTYTDISSTGPILISGSYLFIDGGYIEPTKISLARLVPDASGINAPAQYILEGYTAFNNDGTLIVGTMQTYDGTYTIT